MRYGVIYFQCLCYLALPLCIVSMHLTRCVLWHVVCIFFFCCFLISCFWSCNLCEKKIYIRCPLNFQQHRTAGIRPVPTWSLPGWSMVRLVTIELMKSRSARGTVHCPLTIDCRSQFSRYSVELQYCTSTQPAPPCALCSSVPAVILSRPSLPTTVTTIKTCSTPRASKSKSFIRYGSNAC